MTSPARVAVIVPAYDRADLLPEALESVVDQSYGQWQLVVVDNGSSDDTYAIARSFADRDPERVTVIRLETNIGPAGARNVGIRAAGGELVCLLDSDDALQPGYLARLVGAYDEAIAAGRRPGVVSCDALIRDERGISGKTLYGRYGRPSRVDLDGMVGQNLLVARALLSRAAFEEVGGGFAPECGGSDDHDLWLRILEAGYEAVVVPEPLVIYRHHAGAYSRDRVLQASGKLATYRRALARGALTRRQRRIVARRILRWRAVLEWELLYRALAAGRPADAMRVALRAVPLAVFAFAERPSRWRRWTHVLARQGGALAARRSAPDDLWNPS